MIDDKFFEKNKELKIYRNFKEYNIKIDKNNKIYSSGISKYDIMIIKLNEEDNINEYLELDEKIFNNDSEIFNKTKYIYMLSFSKYEEPDISFGNIINKVDFEIEYNCVSGFCLTGAPILDYYSNKVIGIHKGAHRHKNIKYGTLLRYPLDELNKKN